MILYHVSFNEIKDGMLYPRVPTSRAPHEDKTIPRICFTDSIENCITAMPGGGRALKNLFLRSKMLPISAILHVYHINSNSIKDGNIAFNSEVAQYVQDAKRTGEIWVVNQKVVCTHQIIEVTNVHIKHGYDRYGRDLYEVKYLEWRPLGELPPNAPEIIIGNAKNRLKIDTGFSIRTVLAEWD